ncbi:MarR family winged helix-turn-helix transcriptional regulator [Nakamurella leprariae]|uniref:MarR family transcriptional regulator n=1 Tax=Nakamurella leprariae TaxID=2803911 RepID=A0A938YB17_9ACTN|nr:MarR family transcriptional regulator [Nakamurella leprariae]MBM9469200.1 MarR family transcriptional regulator [Nakamurella leprariae]
MSGLPAPTAPVRAAGPAPNPDTINTLRAAVLVLGRRLRYQTADGDISATEGAVLGRLCREGALTPGDLARGEHVQPPSMSRIIERLEQRGLVTRRPHPEDRRQVLIERTPEGVAFAERSTAVRTEWLTRQFDRLSPPDQQALTRAADALRRLSTLS